MSFPLGYHAAFHRKALGIIGIALSLAACSGVSILNGITPDRGYTQVRDLSFGAQGLKLDVYSPSAATAAPVVVFFYGGSWQDSPGRLKKEAYKFVGQALAAQGFVAVIADYRLFPQVRYPDFLDDCAEAVVWTHGNIGDYGGDPGKLVLMGHSAGAYNAAMLTLDPAYLTRAGARGDWIRGMVGLAGPYDFLPLVDDKLKLIFGPVEGRPLTQPIGHVDGHNPPMLLLAGEDDDVVLVKNSVNLLNAIRTKGGAAQDIIFPKMGHVRLLLGLASSLPGQDAVMKPVAGFIREATDSQAR